MENKDQSGLKPSESENDKNDEVIELTEALTPNDNIPHDEDTENEASIIDLEDMVAPPSAAPEEIIDLINPLETPHDEIASGEKFESDESAPLIDLTDIVQPTEDTTVTAASINVSQEQIEAALEQVIEKVFSEKIEKMMYDAAERAVSKEIRKIRATLMEDSLE